MTAQPVPTVPVTPAGDIVPNQIAGMTGHTFAPNPAFRATPPVDVTASEQPAPTSAPTLDSPAKEDHKDEHKDDDHKPAIKKHDKPSTRNHDKIEDDDGKVKFAEHGLPSELPKKSEEDLGKLAEEAAAAMPEEEAKPDDKASDDKPSDDKPAGAKDEAADGTKKPDSMAVHLGKTHLPSPENADDTISIDSEGTLHINGGEE
jgi:hypothetical protein